MFTWHGVGEECGLSWSNWLFLFLHSFLVLSFFMVTKFFLTCYLTSYIPFLILILLLHPYTL